jgi:hypothetical protein
VIRSGGDEVLRRATDCKRISVLLMNVACGEAPSHAKRNGDAQLTQAAAQGIEARTYGAGSNRTV